ncbi:2-hydroxyacid dehydrogenase [Paucibacter sp. B51]|uniref:2-hydroxyacid dehydrogenase n=1 Tax=Paucibacter sp. B51 TaxID=2993315 RepID=UPI0022EC0655|nr:D-glycerate dehydrogenase [Paucibacter sp. B51]
MSNLAAPKPRVLLARRIFPDIAARMAVAFDLDYADDDQPLSPEALRQRLQGKLGLFASGTEQITAELLDACPELRVISLMTVGHNNVDLAACSARGVRVSNAPDVLTETTADFGFALMMSAARRISESEHYLRRGDWKQWRVDLFAGADIHGATLAILGMGRIGQAIARRGALGFGMKVIYHNRSRLAPEQEAPIGARWVSKEALLREADHLVIVVPYTPASHHLVAEQDLALMKPSATLTNIARGGVVDDVALARALQQGRLAAAGLDVFEGEPQVHPDLLACVNVVLTPHIASASVPTRRAMCELAEANLRAAFSGQPMPTLLNP